MRTLPPDRIYWIQTWDSPIVQMQLSGLDLEGTNNSNEAYNSLAHSFSHNLRGFLQMIFQL